MPTAAARHVASESQRRHYIRRLTSLLEFHENLSGTNWRCQHRRQRPKYYEGANLYCMPCGVVGRSEPCIST